MAEEHERDVRIRLTLEANAAAAKQAQASIKGVTDTLKKESTEAGESISKTNAKAAKDSAAAYKSAMREYEKFTKLQKKSSDALSANLLGVVGDTAKVARGFALLGLAGEKDTEKLVRGLVKIQGFMDTIGSGVAVIMRLSKAMQAYTTTTNAAASAQAALATAQGVAGTAGVGGGAARAAGGAAGGAAAVGGGTVVAAVGAFFAAAAAAKVLQEALMGTAQEAGSLSSKIVDLEKGLGDILGSAGRKAGGTFLFGTLGFVANLVGGTDEETQREKTATLRQQELDREQRRIQTFIGLTSQNARDQLERQRLLGPGNAAADLAQARESRATAQGRLGQGRSIEESARNAALADQADQLLLGTLDQSIQAANKLAAMEQKNSTKLIALAQQRLSLAESEFAIVEKRAEALANEARSAEQRFGLLDPLKQQRVLRAGRAVAAGTATRQQIQTAAPFADPTLQAQAGLQAAAFAGPEFGRVFDFSDELIAANAADAAARAAVQAATQRLGGLKLGAEEAGIKLADKIQQFMTEANTILLDTVNERMERNQSQTEALIRQSLNRPVAVAVAGGDV